MHWLAVSGAKADVVQRVRSALWPSLSPAASGSVTPTPRSYPHVATGLPNGPPLYLPPTYGVTEALPADLTNAWKHLPASHLIHYKLELPCFARRFAFRSDDWKGNPVLADCQLSLTQPAINEDDCRFHLYLFNQSTYAFINDQSWKNGLHPAINGLPLAPPMQRGSETDPFLDITTQIKSLIKIGTGKPSVPVHVNLTIPSYCRSGVLAMLCLRRLPIETAVCRVYEQTLRQYGYKDIPQPPPPTTPLPDGYQAFTATGIPALADAQKLFQDEIISKHGQDTAKKGNSQDDDIEMGNQIVSFQCPLTLMRINIPSKSHLCHHMQCFDCESFLSFNNAPNSKWKCPICARRVDAKDLRIDVIFSKLLSKYPDADRCVILPSGESISYQEASHTAKSTPKGSSSPSASTSALPNDPSSRKRKHSETDDGVIDLEDDDIALVHRAKRATSSARSTPSLPAWSGTVIDLD
ncbi:MIZ/SP-RING zinc finger-domain-containing protein [Fimicolochytrium jonesii]|uniref:MIZ/SP-RING zinc finger-domain-containing protein n=1 Tax=Fimicolochytrium jonesii TaxID=1396493 RepID=UPI0022FE16DA|nr:MIZ/SP-RING zinc finger-domain-containing protein [Fimicolochytrium jonesii]KAI8819647.1 MIZ/SP-RING zinc finger-domain-containing protein [Fimicolochytrium jonesii]